MKQRFLRYKKFAGLFCVMGLLYLFRPFFDNQQHRFNSLLMQKNISIESSVPIQIVYFDQADIAQLGGWPLPRNVYGFLADKLFSFGAKAVGFNIYWQNSPNSNDENNQFLAHTLDQYEIIGGFYFSATADSHHTANINQWPWPPHMKDLRAATGINPPDRQLLGRRAQFGFVNLFAGKSGTVDQAHLLIRHGDACYPSFANLLAAHYSGNGFDSTRTNIRINYVRNADHLPLISAREIVQSQVKDSIKSKLEDSIVLVGIIAPSLGFVKQTPVDPVMPVIAIHAQIVENLIAGNDLRPFPAWIYLFVFSGLVFILYLFRSRPAIQFVILAFSTILLVLAAVALWRFHFVFQLYLYLATIIAFILSSASGMFFESRENYSKEIRMREKLEKELYAKVHSAARLEREHSDLRKKYQHEIKEIRDGLSLLPTENAAPLMQKYSNIIFSSSSPMMYVISELEGIGATDEPALITGESGTGKELVARAIHDNSKRAGNAFIAINCSSIADSLLESELFGYKKGAFTGADKDKAGFFEAAHNGTIFLDEISETSLAFQASLLRVLQEKMLYRVGSTSPTHVDVRIIAATNKKLVQLVNQGFFRSDLYYRLNVLPIDLPPLRQRSEDIKLLVNHFLGNDDIKVSIGALNALKAHHWPGNVRELENICTRMKMIKKDKIIRADWIEKQTGIVRHDAAAESVQDKILNLFREVEFCNDSNTKISQKLGHLHRSTITEYLKGMTFQFFSEEGFHLQKAAKRFNPSQPQLDAKVRTKMLKYLNNLSGLLETNKSISDNMEKLKPHLKKLPGRYQDAALDCALSYVRGLWDLS
jgi:transcriptional regulator with PAS, ATPase and Fis domain/CHASE2 domain-containing sensor protein